MRGSQPCKEFQPRVQIRHQPCSKHVNRLDSKLVAAQKSFLMLLYLSPLFESHEMNNTMAWRSVKLRMPQCRERPQASRSWAFLVMNTYVFLQIRIISATLIDRPTSANVDCIAYSNTILGLSQHLTVLGVFNLWPLWIYIPIRIISKTWVEDQYLT